MKKMMKYTLRAILAIVAMTAFCVLVGEPTEAVGLGKAMLMKVVSIAVMAVVAKIWVLTLSERERRELEDERA